MNNIDTNRKIIKFPKTLNNSSISDILQDISFIFSSQGKQLSNHAFDLSKIRKTNVLGMLLIYKIVEFSCEKKCFTLPVIIFSQYISDMIAEYHFGHLINSYINNKDTLANFKDLRISFSDKCILAPQPLLRNTNFTNTYLNNQLLPRINEYYYNRPKVISMIFTCFSEILLNFWEHAVQDTKSIMIAVGNNDNIEICCADTGNGIISTLKKNQRYVNLSDKKLIAKSVERNVTSKENTNHMGFGLWLIDQIISETQGKLYLYSEGVAYFNEFGKTKVIETGYWKGTIIYLSLPLRDAKSIVDIESFKNTKTDNIKIDFI